MNDTPMRILVTGANGFVGRHLTAHLKAAGHTPLYADINPIPKVPTTQTSIGDLSDTSYATHAILKLKPDACMHLGGIAFVPMGWKNPQLVYHVNLIGTVNLLEAFRKHAPDARILVVTSGEVYGRTASDHPLRENAPLFPANPYAISKQAADMHTLLFAERYNMHTMTARPDNHTGPGQSELFVTASFARQIAEIALKLSPPLMRVGNLDNLRNFTDVRDVVQAYRLILERGKSGQAYNIASGKPARIRYVLDTLCRIANVHPEIKIDPARYRPTDCLPMLDTSRLRNETGWTPKIPIETTLRDIYDYACNQCRHDHP